MQFPSTQENISLCSVGNAVKAIMDIEKDKYVAECGGEIGYFPKSASSYLDEVCKILVCDISSDDEGKYVVKVSVTTDL